MSLDHLKRRLQEILGRVPTQEHILAHFPEHASLNRHHHLAGYVAVRHRIPPESLQLPEPFVQTLNAAWDDELSPAARLKWKPNKREAWERVEAQLNAHGPGYDVLRQTFLGYATAFHMADFHPQFRGAVVDAASQLTAHTCTLYIHQLQQAGCTDNDIMTIFGPVVQHAKVAYRRGCTALKSQQPGYAYLDTKVQDIQPMFNTLLTEAQWFPNADPAGGLTPERLPATDKLNAIRAKTNTQWGLG